MDQVQNFQVIDPRDQVPYYRKNDRGGGSSSSSFNNSDDDNAIDEKNIIEKEIIKQISNNNIGVNQADIIDPESP